MAMVSNRVQSKGTKRGPQGQAMPNYLTRKDNTYYFRQVVPVELRRILDRREIKKSLGRDYLTAVRACKREAVIADNLLAEARAKLDSIPLASSPYSWENIRRTQPVRLTEVTPELETQFGNLVCNSLLETDQNVRIQGMSRRRLCQHSTKRTILSIQTVRFFLHFRWSACISSD